MAPVAPLSPIVSDQARHLTEIFEFSREGIWFDFMNPKASSVYSRLAAKGKLQLDHGRPTDQNLCANVILKRISNREYLRGEGKLLSDVMTVTNNGEAYLRNKGTWDKYEPMMIDLRNNIKTKLGAQPSPPPPICGATARSDTGHLGQLAAAAAIPPPARTAEAPTSSGTPPNKQLEMLVAKLEKRELVNNQKLLKTWTKIEGIEAERETAQGSWSKSHCVDVEAMATAETEAQEMIQLAKDAEARAADAAARAAAASAALVERKKKCAKDTQDHDDCVLAIETRLTDAQQEGEVLEADKKRLVKEMLRAKDLTQSDVRIKTLSQQLADLTREKEDAERKRAAEYKRLHQFVDCEDDDVDDDGPRPAKHLRLGSTSA
jgi:hypothetical protein